MSLKTRQDVARLRLIAAAEHVENAQHELERAASALASLNYMSSEQDKVQTLRDRLHETFYRLSPRSHAQAKACAKATLDRETEPGDENPHKGCCAGYAAPSFKGYETAGVTAGVPASLHAPAASPTVTLVCGGGPVGCGGVASLSRADVDVTTSGHTDKLCSGCSGPMVLKGSASDPDVLR